MIRLKNVSKYYYKKGIVAPGITHINLELNLGEFVAIVGESGSGKSTLLNVISGLDTYEEGEMYVNGLETSHYLQEDYLTYRRKYISNIYQTFNLVNSYTVYENIELAMMLNGQKITKEAREEISLVMKQVDLYKWRNTKVSKLSGGMKQRVAIARCLVSHTNIIIADEPTGNLDSKNAKKILALLKEISKDKLVIIVTHNYTEIQDYVTRVIRMHDSKILEDKKIKEYEKVLEVKEAKVSNITFFNKIKLGIRNAFNVLPKTLLMILVYLFIVIALIGEYASFKEQEYKSTVVGDNYYFSDTSDKRLVVRKNDRSMISDLDYQTISNLENVDYIVKNDLLLDTYYSISDADDYFYIYGTLIDFKNYHLGVDVGRLPTNSNEVLLYGSKYDYYLTSEQEALFKTDFYLRTDYSSERILDDSLKVVGIKFSEESNYMDTKIILQQEVLEKIYKETNKTYSSAKILINNQYQVSDNYSSYFKIIPSNKVKNGEAYFSKNYEYYCKNAGCKNENISVIIDNIYYQSNLNLKITNTYTKNNFSTVTGFTNYDNYDGAIFISPNDYNSLYPKENYQSSIFIKDPELLTKTKEDLTKLGYKVLVIKDTLVRDNFSYIVKIMKVITTFILVITLFFISYFVIKVILKSRNTYFAILRMLGSSKKVFNQVLSFELLTISNLTYFLFLILLYLQKMNVYKITFFTTIINYLHLKDYVVIYLLITVMSIFLSHRFARSIYKKTMNQTFNEEV